MNKTLFLIVIIISELLIVSNSCKAQNDFKDITPRNLDQSSRTNRQFISKLSKEQMKEYEQLLDLTKSFALSLKFLPNIFEPEKESYFESLNQLLIIFVYVSLFPIGLLLIYIIMRFVFNKCKGPSKAKEITPIYKAITWVLLAIGVIGVLILSIFILNASGKVKSGFQNPLTRYIQNIDSIQNSVTPLNDLFTLIYPHLSPTQVDREYLEDLRTDITEYVTQSKSTISKAISDESNRNIVVNIFCYIYLGILIIGLLAFWRRWKNYCMILSLITYLTVSILIIIEGYNAFFYFNSNNICSLVYASMYQNQFPVAGTQIGYYFNCFDKKINSKLFALNYLVDEARTNLKKTNPELYDDITNKQIEHLNGLLQCDRVYSTIPDLEEAFCYKGVELLNSILLYYPWMLVLVFIFGISLNRLEIHIWKNKLDIKAILENSVILY